MLLTEIKTTSSSTPVEGGPAGTFTITAAFGNIAIEALTELAFVVTALTGGNLLLNADESAGGAGSTLTVPFMDGYSDGVLGPGESFTVDFRIGLASKGRFGFFVDAVGGFADDGRATQTFTDLEPTQPRGDEITAPPVDLDSSFPPPGSPVPLGPAGVIDSHFWEHGETTGTSSSLGSETVAANSTAVDPAGEGRWLGKDDGVPVTGGEGSGDVAIHAALLRTKATSTEDDAGAEILWFAGDAFTGAENEAGNVDHTGVFRIISPSLPINKQFKVDKISCPRCPRRQDPPPPPGKPNTADLFCSGHALLEDGRLLVAGGTESFPPEGFHSGHHIAIRNSFIFDPKINIFDPDPAVNPWTETSPMNFQPDDNFEPGTSGGGKSGGGRWYPTLLPLNSGRVLAFWGHPADRAPVVGAPPDDTRHTNDTPEIFTPEPSGWKLLGRETDLPGGRLLLGYPRVHLLPNGRVFRATTVPDMVSPPTKNVEINPIPESLADRDSISVKVSSGPGTGFSVTGDSSYSSVLLPLTPANSYRARILLAGGGVEPEGTKLRIVAAQPQLIHLDTFAPGFGPLRAAWTATGPRAMGIHDKARIHANATILPTGEVFMSGGSHCVFLNCRDADDNLEPLAGRAVLQGEIYDPFQEDRLKQWRTVASARVPRSYHSVALLMPDGRVWHAGTGEAQGFANQQGRVEIYEPWYYTEARPVIQGMSTVGPPDPIYGGGIVMHPHDSDATTIAVDSFRDVKKFALVAAGSATHSFNAEQRYIELHSRLVGAVVLTPPSAVQFTRFFFELTAPPSSSIAPPGNYMLFALDDRGVPSVGRFIRIDRQFAGELKQEAEDITSFLPVRVPVIVGPFPRFTLPMFGEPEDRRPVEYGGIDFGTQAGAVGRITARLSSEREQGEIVVRLDSPLGTKIASLQVPDTGDRFNFVELSAPLLRAVSGVHNLFVSYISPIPLGNIAFVDWFTLKPPAPP